MTKRLARWILCIVFVIGVSIVLSADALLVDSGQRLGDGASTQVALGDLDGDGDLDAVIGSEYASAILWINDGQGVFVESSANLSTGNAVAIADLDGDGFLDVLVGSMRASLVPWWNDGSGIFVRGESLVGSGTMEIVAADMNGDALIDIFVGRSGRDQLLLNNGARGFETIDQVLSSSYTGGVAIGDMDGDGDPDVVTAGWNGAGVVWANDGHGELSSLCEIPTYSLHVHSAELVDIDRDGDLDVFFATAGGLCCQNMWLNDGHGQLTVNPFDFGSETMHGVAIGDVNSDGWNDAVLAVGIVGTAPSRLWLGGEDGFTDSGIAIGNAFARDVALGDLDGDGDLDLMIPFSKITASYSFTPVPEQVWLNTTND